MIATTIVGRQSSIGIEPIRWASFDRRGEGSVASLSTESVDNEPVSEAQT